MSSVPSAGTHIHADLEIQTLLTVFFIEDGRALGYTHTHECWSFNHIQSKCCASRIALQRDVPPSQALLMFGDRD